MPDLCRSYILALAQVRIVPLQGKLCDRSTSFPEIPLLLFFSKNVCSHLVPAIKQDIASTEYGVSPAAVKSSPGTKMLTIAEFSGFESAWMIFFITILATYCPDLGSFLSEKRAVVSPEVDIL